jgi:MYXO-CTERM domain-containing protein
VTGAPRGSRQACASDGTTCGGVCDGVTADRCTYKGAGTSCRPGKCANGLADLEAFCQGNGSCAPLQQQSCDPGNCDVATSRCQGDCTTNADCTTDQYCSAGICAGKLADGSTCGADAQCTHANCVDGLCCDGACDGPCEACDQVGSLGKCTAVVGAPRNGRAACLGSGACGGFCDGTSGAGCSLPGRSQTCGSAFCANAVASKAPTCNGSATCILPAPAGCDPYQCDPDHPTCLTGCQVDDDCAPGLVCISGGCTQPIPGMDAGPGPDASTGGATAAGGAESVDSGTGSGGRSTGSGGATGGTGGKATGGRMNGTGGSGGESTSVDGGVTPPDGGSEHAGSGDKGGCGCVLAGDPSHDAQGAATVLVGLGLFLARRRRSLSNARASAERTPRC